MIPKGNLHANGGKLATYITKGEDDEKAELIEMRGFASDDLREAFSDIQDIADSQTKCEKPFFHAYVRLPKDESLTRAQWLETANRIEAKLGFDGQPRGVALHFLEDGTAHMHVAWSRIDTDQMKAIDPGLYLRKMKEVCRELEVEFGLRQVSSELPGDRQTAAPKRPEFEQDRRLGIDGTEAREAIRSCYDRSDNGPSFISALAEFDITRARGDRYAFVAVDSEGGLHALGKRMLGVTLAEIEGKLGAEFATSLPTVDAVREGIEARQEAAPASPEVETKEAPQAQPEGRQSRDAIKRGVTELWNASDSGEAFVAGLEGLGLTLAKGDRRGFVLVHQEGEVYALPRLIEGARTADVREKLRDIDPASLPTVAEAAASMELAAAAREHTARREDNAPESATTSEDTANTAAAADEIENSKTEKGEPHPGDAAAMAGAAIVGALAEGAAKIADAIGDLIAPPAPLTREQQEENRAKAERAEAAAAPIREARREMTEEEARLAAIAKAQAAMEEALNESQAERDRKDRDDDYGYERTR